MWKDKTPEGGHYVPFGRLAIPPPPPVFAALLYVNNTAVTVRKGGYRPELKPARGNEREKGLRAFRRPFDIHGGRRGT